MTVLLRPSFGRAALLSVPLALVLGAPACGEPAAGPAAPAPTASTPTAPTPPGGWQDNFVERARYRTEMGLPGPQFVEILDVEVAGEQLLVCTGTQGLMTVRRDTLTITEALSPSSGGARCQHVERDGERVLMANRGDEWAPVPNVTLFSLSPDGALQELASLTSDEGLSYEGLAVIAPGRYAAALHDAGVALIDFIGGQLVETQRITGPGNAWHVRAQDGHLFVADADMGVHVFALHPRGGPAELLATLPLPGATQHLELAGDLLLASSGASGVQLIDVSVLAAPVLLSTIDTPGSALMSAYADDYVYIADWTSARVYDVHDRSAPFLEAIETPDVNVFARILALDAEADRAFLGEWTGLYDYQLLPGMHAPDIGFASFGLVFPQTEPGSSTVRGLTIVNEGTESLTITGVEPSGEPGGPFEPITMELSVLPGERGDLEIRFTPEGDWQHDDGLIVHSDDPDEPAVWLPLKGNGYGLSVGDAIPAYEWQDLSSGEPIKMQALAGSVVVLSYFATF